MHAKGFPDKPVDGLNVTDGVWMTRWMESHDDVDRLYESACKSGAIVTFPPTDEPWGVREFHLRHPDGQMFRVSSGLTQSGLDTSVI